MPRIDEPRPPAVPATEDQWAGACRNMLRHKHLAHAMITSTQAVRAQTGATGDRAVRDLILATAGLDRPSADQVRFARLVEQVTFGVLTWTVGGELATGDGFNSAAETPARVGTTGARRRG